MELAGDRLLGYLASESRQNNANNPADPGNFPGDCLLLDLEPPECPTYHQGSSGSSSYPDPTIFAQPVAAAEASWLPYPVTFPASSSINWPTFDSNSRVLTHWADFDGVSPAFNHGFDTYTNVSQ